MTKGVASPLMMVERSRRATSRAKTQPDSMTSIITVGAWSPKKAAASSRNTGSLAPQLMYGRVSRVASFSLGLRRVRVAMAPGMAQPPAIPPAMI